MLHTEYGYLGETKLVEVTWQVFFEHIKKHADRDPMPTPERDVTWWKTRKGKRELFGKSNGYLTLGEKKWFLNEKFMD